MIPERGSPPSTRERWSDIRPIRSVVERRVNPRSPATHEPEPGVVPMSKPEPGTFDWLQSHGIDPDVWAARGVRRYTSEDVELVKQAVDPFIQPRQRSFVTRVVKQSDGLLLPKCAPPGFSPVPPQLRPDNEVVTDPRPRWRYHGKALNEGDSWPRTPQGVPLHSTHVLTPERAEAHIQKRHDGVNTDDVHRDDKKPAKYVFLPSSDQKRIDLHPMAGELLPDAERVFFALEGALKNDAILSAGEAVLSVPSVTLWKRRELQSFARRFLRGKVVFVVPDADWFSNSLVDLQALLVREVLREVLGDQSVHIAAPPIEFMKEVDGKKKDQGVDDWLGTPGLYWAQDAAHVPNIAGLVIRGKEPGRGVREWDGDPVEQRALIGLSLHARDGRHCRHLSSLADILGLRSRRPEEAIALLERLRAAIIVHGSLSWKKHTFKVGHQVPRVVKDWEVRTDPPVIELRHAFRAVEVAPTLLGDFWADEGRSIARDVRDAITAEKAEQEARLRAVLGAIDRRSGKLRV